MSCMNQNFRLLHYRIYTFETFEFFWSCIRGHVRLLCGAACACLSAKLHDMTITSRRVKINDGTWSCCHEMRRLCHFSLCMPHCPIFCVAKEGYKEVWSIEGHSLATFNINHKMATDWSHFIHCSKHVNAGLWTGFNWSAHGTYWWAHQSFVTYMPMKSFEVMIDHDIEVMVDPDGKWAATVPKQYNVSRPTLSRSHIFLI